MSTVHAVSNLKIPQHWTGVCASTSLYPVNIIPPTFCTHVTVCHYLSLSVTICHYLSLSVTVCHCLSLSCIVWTVDRVINKALKKLSSWADRRSKVVTCRHTETQIACAAFDLLSLKQFPSLYDLDRTAGYITDTVRRSDWATLPPSVCPCGCHNSSMVAMQPALHRMLYTNKHRWSATVQQMEPPSCMTRQCVDHSAVGHRRLQLWEIF
jgi:hypothetical protein